MSYYPPALLLEAADILDKAHDVLLVRGWRGMGRHDLPPEALCVEAAVVHVVTGQKVCVFQTFRNGTTKENVCLIPEWLEHLLYVRGIHFTWNDELHRTADEVFDKLRATAKQLREEAGAQ